MSLQRPTRPPSPQAVLFDLGNDWQEHWWGMPEFNMGDARPAYQITMNFLTRDDLREFSKLLGQAVSSRTDSLWYPKQKTDKASTWEYQR